MAHLYPYTHSYKADDPKFAIYIVLDEPDGTTGTSGSTSDALILAKDIMTELLPYMNVYKDTDEPYVSLSFIDK